MKKLIFLPLLLILLWPVSGWGAWAHVQSGITGYDTSAATIPRIYGSNVTAGNLLVCTLGFRNPAGTITVTGVADSLTQTWTVADQLRTVAGVGGSWSVGVWYFANTAGGANTVTVTLSAAAAERALTCSEYSGIATSTPLDQSLGATQVDPGTGTNAVTTGTTGATSANNELVYAGAIAVANSVADAAGTGFTLRATTSTPPPTNFTLMSEDKNLASAGTTAGTFTIETGTEDTAAIVATFKEPAAAGTALQGQSMGGLIGVIQ